MNLKPVRKVAAALWAVLAGSAGFAAFIAGTGALPWRDLAVAAIGAVVPIVVAWLRKDEPPPA